MRTIIQVPGLIVDGLRRFFRAMSKPHQTTLVVVMLALFLAVALYLRIALPYNHIFGSDWVKFSGVDAYYHMRIVDNLVHNFPHLNSFDPYVFYPKGGGTSSQFPFFDYLLAGIIWLVGLGSPSQHTVDVVSVYFPAILGALTIIPVYFIGKVLFSHWAGVISAGLAAIFPGEFLGRSILGFTDHHVAEVLFTTTAMLFLILAVKNAKKEQLTLTHLRHPIEASLSRPLLYSFLAGLFLGMYVMSWEGALLFIFMITAYFLIQLTVDHLGHRPVDCMCLVSSVTLLTALVISVPLSHEKVHVLSLVVALVLPLALTIISRLMSRKRLSPVYFPLTLAGIGALAFGIFYAIDAPLLRRMISKLGFFSWDTNAAKLEMQPLFFPSGHFSLSLAWANFTTSLVLGIVALGILIYLVIRYGGADRTLLIVWTLVILAAAAAQCRFSYYLVVNIALLAGYLSWQILRMAGSQKDAAEPAVKPKRPKKTVKTKTRKAQRRGLRTRHQQLYTALAVIAIFCLVFLPNIGRAKATASQARFAPSNAWCESLSWLRENTPEPFGDPASYYERYGTPFEYPETAYGVAAWWDYGYWIVRIAHRMPMDAKPLVADIFLAQDEASANSIMDDLGTRYLIVDNDIVTAKFYAVVASSESSHPAFYDVFYRNIDGRLVPATLYFPEYYRSLCVRLYNFGGQAVTPQLCTVISWEQRKTGKNTFYKLITSERAFSNYEEATAYMAQQASGQYQIVSSNPFASPVPLERLKYRLVHNSEDSVASSGGGAIPAIRIFEYVK